MKKIKILIPVYNDWKSVFKLLEVIDSKIKDWKYEVSVFIIDDASSEKKIQNEFYFKNLKSIQILVMKENKGHARCNALGLKYIYEKEEFDFIILMDGDGEDRPDELVLFFQKLENYPDKVITANRVKRSEGLIFKFCYLVILSEIPLTYALIMIGVSLNDLILKDLDLISVFYSMNFLLPFFLIVIVIFLTNFIKKKF